MTLAVPDVLSHGEITVDGRMPWSSNATFLCTLRLDDEVCQAIYKPARGERPLWDFPSGLYRREIAAYELSEALGWDLVPPTIEREGPHGVGSWQLFINADFEQHHFTIYEKRLDLHDRLRAMCAFDLLANNTDRKSGHVLIGAEGQWQDAIVGIDHGVCFHEEWKLRTVIWEFAFEPFSDLIGAGIQAIANKVPETLLPLLDGTEVDALRDRAQHFATVGQFPSDPTGRRYPWPLI